MASTRGWLLMLDLDGDADLEPFDDNPTLPFSSRPFLFNPITSAMILLPMLLIYPGDEHFGALSSPPYDSDCTILFLSGRSVFLCRLSDPDDGWTMRVEIEERIDSVVYCDGKFYCISRNRVLYVIDGVGSTSTPLRLTMDDSALNIRDGDMCRLVEFGGELLLVRELYLWHCYLEGFQVFKADLSGEKWVKKTDMLTDHVLFLDDCCSFSLLASDVGCKKNCIYYTCGDAPHFWRVFDLDTRNWIHQETTNRDFCLGRWFLPTLG